MRSLPSYKITGVEVAQHGQPLGIVTIDVDQGEAEPYHKRMHAPVHSAVATHWAIRNWLIQYEYDRKKAQNQVQPVDPELLAMVEAEKPKAEHGRRRKNG